jgi:hypothetical protein
MVDVALLLVELKSEKSCFKSTQVDWTADTESVF